MRWRDVGTEWCAWRDVAAVVEWLDNSSAVFRALHPEYHEWGLPEFLLAEQVDLLNYLVWFKTKDGSKGRNRPKPWPRPGVDEPTKVHRGEVVPLEQALTLFDVPRV